MAQPVKHKSDNLSSDPQNPCEGGMWWHMSVISAFLGQDGGGGELQRSLEANKKDCLKHIGREGPNLKLPSDLHVHTMACAHPP